MVSSIMKSYLETWCGAYKFKCGHFISLQWTKNVARLISMFDIQGLISLTIFSSYLSPTKVWVKYTIKNNMIQWFYCSRTVSYQVLLYIKEYLKLKLMIIMPFSSFGFWHLSLIWPSQMNLYPKVIFSCKAM